MKNTNLESILHDVANKEIIFAAVEDYRRGHIVEDGIHFFPNELELRKFKFGKNNVIWLNKVADSNCKKCYGTGKTGTLLKQIDYKTYKEIQNILSIHLGKGDCNIAELINSLIKGNGIDYLEPLIILVDMAEKEIQGFNSFAIATKYAQMIKKDMVVGVVLWCECFTANLRKEVDRVRRNIKFSIN